MTGDERSDYELALGAALPLLQQFTTMAALVHHYFDDRCHSSLLGSKEPSAGTVEAWVKAAVLSVPTQRILIPDCIEDAAFWRRLRQLIATQVTSR